jgi:Tfp pilus assembly PilM family ATPase/Tfp pilus assembly protein PilN
MPVQSEPALVLILSPKRVAAAELQYAGGSLTVSNLGDITVPEGTFDMGQLANGELLGRALASFTAEKRIAARRVAMVLPEGTAITQLIKLPVMPREDMLGAVRAVAERYATFAEHDIAVDCCVVQELDEDGKRMSNVLLAASRVATIEQCQECARTAGLDLISVEVMPVAAARAYRERFLPSQVVALAVVGETRTDVMIFDGGDLKLCYSANAGLPEQGAPGDWMTPPTEERDPFAPPPQLYSELSHCFRFFQNQFPGRAVDRVLVAADHARADLVASHLAEQLQLPVELARPAYELALPMEVDGKAAGVSRALSLAEFRGGALGILSEGEAFLPVNLLPVSRALWVPARGAIKVGALAMGLVLLVSIVWSASLSRRIGRDQQQLAGVRAEIALLQPKLDQLRALKATEQALRSEVERETARIARERAVRWSQILVDLSARLPDGMWLTQTSSPDTSRIVINGIATNREVIPRAIESLSGSPYLSNVVLGSLSKDDTYAPGQIVIRFQINAALRRGLLMPAVQTAAGTPQTQEATP